MAIPEQFDTILFRLGEVEQDVKEIRKDLSAYVPKGENEIEKSRTFELLARIDERLKHAEESTVAIAARVEKAQQEQNILQTRILLGAIGAIFSLIGSVLVGYITHFFH